MTYCQESGHNVTVDFQHPRDSSRFTGSRMFFFEKMKTDRGRSVP